MSNKYSQNSFVVRKLQTADINSMEYYWHSDMILLYTKCNQYSSHYFLLMVGYIDR